MPDTMMSRTAGKSRLNGQCHGKNSMSWLDCQTNFEVSPQRR